MLGSRRTPSPPPHPAVPGPTPTVRDPTVDDASPVRRPAPATGAV